MYSHALPTLVLAGLVAADVLTTIDGKQCTLRSSVVPVITGGASRTGSAMSSFTGGASYTTSGSSVISGTDTSIPSPTTASPSGTPATPLPGPVSTNANGVPVYSDRSVCGAIFMTDMTDFYAIYCNSGLVSNNILKAYSMNPDLTPVTLDQCVISCSLVSNPSVPNGRCEGAVFYNGTSLPSPLCNLYGANNNNVRRDTEDSTLSLVYAVDSYAALPLSSVNSTLPPAPAAPNQPPQSSSTISPSSTASASPLPSSNSTAQRLARNAPVYQMPKRVPLDLSYVH